MVITSIFLAQIKGAHIKTYEQTLFLLEKYIPNLRVSWKKIEKRQSQLKDMYTTSYIIDELVFELFTEMLELVQDLLEDSQEWIAWYIHDNEWGTKNYTAGFDGKLEVISSIKELAKLIAISAARAD